jgi:hypothetical protein
MIRPSLQFPIGGHISPRIIPIYSFQWHTYWILTLQSHSGSTISLDLAFCPVLTCISSTKRLYTKRCLFPWLPNYSTSLVALIISLKYNSKAILVAGCGGRRIVSVEDPTFSRQSVDRWRRGCQPYAPAWLYTPGRFLLETESTPGPQYGKKD